MLSNPLFYLSLFGLVAKIYAGHRLKQNLSQPGARLCMILLLVVYAQTVLELFAFYSVQAETPYDSLLILKLYYLLIIAALLIVPILFFNIINRRLNPYLLLAFSLVFIFMLGMLDTKLMIAGTTNTEYFITRIKGPYYWVFQIFVLLIFLSTLSSLLYVYKTTNQEIIKVKSANILISFIPAAIFGFITLILMALGFNFTASGFTPILSGFLVILLAHTMKPHIVLDFRAFIPGTKKFKMVTTAIKPFVYCTTSTAYKNFYEEYDLSLIKVADDQFKLNAEKAKWLGVSVPTFYKKKARFKKYKQK